MNYRILGKTGQKVSVLGFGCMRLPVINGNMSWIDEPEAVRMIRYALDQGVNYIDTAYVYHEGKSEPLVAKALKDGYREKAMIATKLPVWNVKKYEDMEKLLDEQLRNLDTDCIDFYLVHALNKVYWSKLVSMGLFDFLLKSREKGKVKYLGFSFHDEFDLFKEIIDSFDWSFCQIQYNYLDENFQAGRRGLKYAYSKGLGIVVMEPLRGGALVNRLSPEAKTIMENAAVKRTPAEWGLKWVWNHPEVGVVLSGMSTMEQVKANIKYAEESEIPLSPEDSRTISAIQKSYTQKLKIRCTSCKYCMPCPEGVNIAQCFDLYNRAFMLDDVKGALFWYNRIPDEKGRGRASDCVECGECEKHCPQNISIRERLKEVRELFGC